MFGLFEALNEINNSIFKHDNVESGNGDPLRKSPSPPLKDSPKINPKNEVFDFLSTIFNLCSGGERRNCVRENVNSNQDPFQANQKEESLYKVYLRNGHDIPIMLSKDDFRYSDSQTLFKIQPLGHDNQIPRSAVIINEKKIEAIYEKTSYEKPSQTAWM